MSHTHSEFKIKDDKVLVYRRSDSGDNWHCRIKFPNQPYIRRSLKTDIKEEAKKKASKIYEELSYRQEQGYSVVSRKFSAMCEGYLSRLLDDVEKGREREGKYKDHKIIIERYLKPYFGRKNVNLISNIDMEDYEQWRKDYWVSGEGSKLRYIEYERDGKIIRSKVGNRKTPSNNTLNYENAVLRNIFNYAAGKGFVIEGELPKVKNRTIKDNRRPAFDLKEYQKLIKTSEHRYKNARTKKLKFQRQLLHEYILFMANTGCRPIEAATLRWRDINEFTGKDKNGQKVKYLKISVRGKGKNRDFVPMQNTKTYLDRLKALLEDKEFGDRKLKPDDYVFSDENGNSIASFKKGFNQLLKAADLEYDNEGRKRTIYSFRHTYATFRLNMGGVSVYDLAMNMGTSVEMIERHYGHLKPQQVADRLTGFL